MKADGASFLYRIDQWELPIDEADSVHELIEYPFALTMSAMTIRILIVAVIDHTITSS